MDTYKGLPYCQVLLMNEDRSLSLTIGFLGYTYDGIEDYMNKNFVECKQLYAGRWTQMKYLNADGAEL